MSMNQPKNDIYSGFMENAYNFNDEFYNNEPLNTGYLSTAVKTSSYVSFLFFNALGFSILIILL